MENTQRVYHWIGKVKVLLWCMLLMACTAATTQAQNVYITRTGAKYHASGCRYLSQNKISISLNDALSQGFSACSVCRPSSTGSDNSASPANAVTYPSSNSLSTPAATPAVRESTTTSRQCSAYTKAGSQCKRMTTSSSGKCWQHE